MDNTNYFLGIDLGTTNSVIAYANPRANGELKPMVVEVPRVSDTGGTRNEKTLPSVVYYRLSKDGKINPIVGDFAKAQYGKRFGFVIKSVKSSMGKPDVPDINQDVQDKTPSDISAKILQQLLAGAKKQLLLEEQPKDVIITIPASFDGDQCKATLEAAAEAGVEAYNENGSPKDILLYEPKAVLYDIINSQMNGEIPTSIMDISTPKNILVYDLGGGTLDVSLYKVSKNDKDELLNIEDMAISRYTQIGGDNFDYLIAKNLCKQFVDMYQGELKIDEQVTKEIMSIFVKKAENLKLNMSNAYDIIANRGQILPDDHIENVNDFDLYNGLPFDVDISKRDMLDFIRPLMGENLSLNSVNNINNLTKEQDINNIIYPILDVLSKAKTRYGSISVDYIILNGGMSRFFPVVDRIKEFFGKTPISLNDPDLSVAKGAAVYHYYLHKYNNEEHIKGFTSINETITKPKVSVTSKTAKIVKETKTVAAGTLISRNNAQTSAFNQRILNDTLNLEVRGGWMFPIAKAGTKLPFVSDNLEILKLPKDGDCIRLPLYYGSGKKAELPNRKIAERILTFPRAYGADTPISIQVTIDQLNIISIRTWVTGKNEELGHVSMAANDIATPITKFAGNGLKNTKKPVLANSTVGLNVNFRSECNQLYSLCQTANRAKRQLKKHSPINAQIKETVARMKMALNGNEAGSAINEAIDRFNNNSTCFIHLLGIGAKLAPTWDRYEKSIFRNKCRHLLETVVMNAQWAPGIQGYHMQAINGLANLKNPEDIPLIEKLLVLGDKSFPGCAAIALGKMQANPTLLIKQTVELTPMDIAKLDPHWWAIGKLCSREMNLYHDKFLLQYVTEKCIIMLKNKQIQNPSIINSLAYACGELCDTRPIVEEPLPHQYINNAREALRQLKSRIVYTELEQTCIRKIEIALKMVNGEALSEADGAQLLAIRDR